MSIDAHEKLRKETMMIESMSPVGEGRPRDAAAVLAPEPDPAPGASRIDWLFRDALRNRQLHPLMELVRSYRRQDTP
jgi:hypothetical protein